METKSGKIRTNPDKSSRIVSSIGGTRTAFGPTRTKAVGVGQSLVRAGQIWRVHDEFSRYPIYLNTSSNIMEALCSYIDGERPGIVLQGCHLAKP